MWSQRLPSCVPSIYMQKYSYAVGFSWKSSESSNNSGSDSKMAEQNRFCFEEIKEQRNVVLEWHLVEHKPSPMPSIDHRHQPPKYANFISPLSNSSVPWQIYKNVKIRPFSPRKRKGETILVRSLDPDPHQKLMLSILGQNLSSIKVLLKSFH